MINSKRLAVTLLDSVRSWVEPAFASVNDRLDQFEVRLKAIPAGADGKDGKDGERWQDGERGQDGRDADPEFIRTEIDRQIVDVAERTRANLATMLETSLAALPKAKDGAPGKDAEPIHPDTIARMVNESLRLALKEIPAPKDGKDADPAYIDRLVSAAVISAVAEIPRPKDGERGLDGRDADPQFIRSEIAKALAENDSAEIDNSDFVDMADELLRGLEGAVAELPAASAPALNMQFHVPGADGSTKGRSNGIGAREQVVIGNMIANSIRDTLMLPVKPVYDAKGKLLYGQRVPKTDQN